MTIKKDNICLSIIKRMCLFITCVSVLFLISAGIAVGLWLFLNVPMYLYIYILELFDYPIPYYLWEDSTREPISILLSTVAFTVCFTALSISGLVAWWKEEI